MERIESRFSLRARRLISRAFMAGVDPLHLKHESSRAVVIAAREGRRATRSDLGNLIRELEILIGSQRLNPELPMLGRSVRPWNPDEFWNM